MKLNFEFGEGPTPDGQVTTEDGRQVHSVGSATIRLRAQELPVAEVTLLGPGLHLEKIQTDVYVIFPDYFVVDAEGKSHPVGKKYLLEDSGPLLSAVSSLLAMIHGDGGHYEEKVGAVCGLRDAEARIHGERTEQSYANHAIASWQAYYAGRDTPSAGALLDTAAEATKKYNAFRNQLPGAISSSASETNSG